MSAKNSVRHAIIKDFRAATEGKLPDEKIERAVKTMESWATSWPCDGEIGAAIFTATVNLHATVNGIRLKFFGNAGGVFGLGGDKIGGVLFSDNILALFFKTTTFEYHGFPHYTGVVFFDADLNVLGHFEGDGIGLAGGLGGGLGGWNWDD